MFCPECRAEYREGFYTCSDCGVSLVSELLPEPPPESVEFEEVNISLSASDMAMIKSLLDCEGIVYYFRGESSYSFAPIELMVRKDQADQAREILEGLKISEPLASEGSRSEGEE
jgi:hypothetical protein